MSIGSLVRAALGPAEPAIGRAYRRAFFDFAAFSATLAGWAKPERILDVGCGDGLSTRQLAIAFPFAQLVGIDVAPAVGKLFDGDRSRVSFRSESVDAFVSAHPASFDMVVLADVLHHVPPSGREALLRRACGALREGGLLVVKDWERRTNLAHLFAWFSDRFITGSPVWFETAAGLRALVERSAGAVEREVRLPPWRNNLALLIRPRAPEAAAGR
jgi:2-polyprenyl-6-hydroxyphenyl methylase/3-demethylubiquinone-9 3-methyltransferase